MNNKKYDFEKKIDIKYKRSLNSKYVFIPKMIQKNCLKMKNKTSIYLLFF